MDASIINPFINATLNVLKTMARLEPVPEKPYLKKTNETWGSVTGLIGLAGAKANGCMTISFDEPTALAVVNALLMEKFEKISDEVVDAIGEITNMICGGAKAELDNVGYQFNLAIPSVIVGEKVEMKQLSKSPIIVVPFKLPMGSFAVESNLTVTKG